MRQVPLAAGMASSSSGCRWQGGALVGGGPGEKGAWAECLGRVGRSWHRRPGERPRSYT